MSAPFIPEYPQFVGSPDFEKAKQFWADTPEIEQQKQSEHLLNRDHQLLSDQGLCWRELGLELQKMLNTDDRAFAIRILLQMSEIEGGLLNE